MNNRKGDYLIENLIGMCAFNRLQQEVPCRETARGRAEYCTACEAAERLKAIDAPLSQSVEQAKAEYIGARFRAETESMRQAQGDDNADIVGCARGERDRKFDALIAAVLAHGREWQPIETAPKDRTVILRPHVIWGPMDVYANRQTDVPWPWVNGDHTTGWPDEAFLPFWMPLPDPPEMKTDHGAGLIHHVASPLVETEPRPNQLLPPEPFTKHETTDGCC